MARKNFLRTISGVLVFVLLFSLMPVSVFAADDTFVSKTIVVTDADGAVDGAAVAVGGATGTTGVDGKVTFDNLTAETEYTVSVTKEGYAPKEAKFTAGTEDEVSVTLTKYTVVTVTGVVTCENNPVSGATVTLIQNGKEATPYTTGDDGAYSFANVYKELQAKVKVSAPGRVTKEVDVDFSKSNDIALEWQKFKLTKQIQGNGEVELPEEVKYGEKVTVTIKANDGSSIYSIKDYSIKDGDVSVMNDASGSAECEYIINNVTADHKITVVFAEDEQVLHFWVDADGQLWEKNDKDEFVKKGIWLYPGLKIEKIQETSQLALTYKPADNYRVTEVTVDGTVTGYEANDRAFADELFTLDKDKDEKREYTIKVARNQFKIDTNDDETITLSTEDGYVDYDRSVTLTFTVKEGEYLSKLEINGADCTSDVKYNGDKVTYTINNVTEDKNVVVEYAEIAVAAYEVAVAETDVAKTDGTTYYLSNLNKDANVTFSVKEKKVSRNEHGPFEDGIVVKGTESLETIYVLDGTAIYSVAYKAKVVKDTTDPTIDKVDTTYDWKPHAWWYVIDKTHKIVTVSDNEGGSGIAKVVYLEKNKKLNKDIDPEKLTDDRIYELLKQGVLKELSQNGDGTWQVSFAGDQKSELYFWAIDYAGNISGKTQNDFDNDTNEPDIKEFDVSKIMTYANGNYAKTGVEFAVKCSDEWNDITEVLLTIGEKTYKMTTTQKNVQPGTDITFKATVADAISGEVSVSVRDASTAVTDENGKNGNVATATLAEVNGLSSNKLTLEATAPAITVTEVASTVSNGQFHSSDVTFKATIEDTGAGLILYNGKVLGLTVKNGNTEIPYTIVEGSTVYEKYSVKETVQVEQEDGTFVDKEQTVEKDTGKITKATVTFTATGEDAKVTNYDITIQGQDAVGNIGKAEGDSLKFSIDKTKPVISKIDIYGTIFDASKGENGEEVDSTFETIPIENEADVTATDYGYHFQKNTKVKVWASDNGSEVKEICFYTVAVVDVDGVATEVTGEVMREAMDADHWNKNFKLWFAEFEVPANFKGQIYAYAIDNVDNTSDTYEPTQKTTVESQDDHSNVATIEFVMPEPVGVDADRTDIYTTLERETDADGKVTESLGELPISVKVSDTFNGVSKITYTVQYPADEAKTYEVNLNEDSGWSVTTTDANLNTVIEGTISLTEEGNAIEVTVTMWDNAGNKSTEPVKLSIDNTAPVVEVFHVAPGEVVYENAPTDGTPQESLGDTPYFIGFRATDENSKELPEADAYPMYAGGTLQIKITERNFDEEKLIKSAKKYLEGDKLENIIANDQSASFTKVFGPYYDAEDEEGKTVRMDAEYPFVENVYYIVELRGCNEEDKGGTYVTNFEVTDRAGFNEKLVEFFVIDEIAPAVSITFDNNDVRNGKYYNAERTATITVVERNFSNESGAIEGKASDDGKAFAFPTLGAWTDSANMTSHSAKVSFTSDGLYEDFVASYADLAGNEGSDEADDFVVDTTMPEIVITGVEDKSANNGVVAPVITYTDTNINLESLELDLTGANNGVVKYSATITDIHNGQTYAYADFTYEKSVDDIYTLFVHIVDLAGNETTETISFSCNRFGSVFDLSEIKDMLGKYNQKERPLVITETNVDAVDIKNMRITLTKNGNPVDLILGTDFTVKALGGNGSWSQYVYTIKDSLFADDGTYSLYFYTEDAAGNINENIDETKDAQVSFGIDKTTPIINPVDFESNTQYAEDGKTVTIEIKDNLVLDAVQIFLNGEEVEYTVDGETYTFFVPKSNAKQTVRVVGYDAAGNKQEMLIEDFLVTTNLLARWYNNTPLFIGSLIALAVLAGVGGWRLFLIFGKKDEEEDT